jgi:hypothetical protein
MSAASKAFDFFPLKTQATRSRQGRETDRRRERESARARDMDGRKRAGSSSGQQQQIEAAKALNTGRLEAA